MIKILSSCEQHDYCTNFDRPSSRLKTNPEVKSELTIIRCEELLYDSAEKITKKLKPFTTTLGGIF
jgi:hypothetical protein